MSDKDPDHDVRLRFLKALINLPLRLFSKLVVFPRNPHYIQTVMLMDLHATLKKIYRFEVAMGTPFSLDKNGVPDGNFERLLDLSAAVLAQISERDRYYRAWIGLLVFLAEKQRCTMTTDPVVLKRLIREQWDINADCVPDETIKRFARDFQEIALCDNLGNLANRSTIELTGMAKYKKKQK